MTSSDILFEKIVGNPAACASTPTTGKPSYKLGRQNISITEYSLLISSRWPRKSTESLRPSLSTFFLISSSSGPEPTSKSFESGFFL